jgi:hypothetical protein
MNATKIKLEIDNVDWNNYSNDFPTRYLKESRLDTELHKIVSDLMLKNEYINILDVGGGPQFTMALRRFIGYRDDVVLSLLDPYVKMNVICENDQCIQTTWDIVKKIVEGNRNSEPKFDLIVLRSSLNYLTLDEINILSSCVRSDGLLIANSFANALEVKRKIVTGDGRLGYEECIPVQHGDMTLMQHILMIENHNAPIETVVKHNFYYHNPMDVVCALGSDGVSIEFYNNNSVLYKYKK